MFMCRYKADRCPWVEILQSMHDRELMGNPGFIMVLYHLRDGRQGKKTKKHWQTVDFLSAYLQL